MSRYKRVPATDRRLEALISFATPLTWPEAQRRFQALREAARELADARIPAASFLCFQQVPMAARLPVWRR
jgi:hypothetical protein